MKDGLRQRLNNWIKAEQGQIVYVDSIERQVKLWGYKISNYERRLRPSESPNIERVMKNGAIVGYRWKQSEVVSSFLRDFPSKPKEPVKTEGVLF
jgi:hypothetical protein